MKLANLSAITAGMTDAEQKRWEASVEEAKPVLKQLLNILEKRIVEIDKNMCLDTVRKSSSDVTITLISLQAEKDALNQVINQIK